MIYAIHHHLAWFSRRSSFPPLLEIMDCRVVDYHCWWKSVEKRSWSLAHHMRGWGNKYYGSSWNWFFPVVQELGIANSIRPGKGDVVHFMMAEYGSPRHPRWFNRRGARLVGTFHCSARRLEQVLGRYRCLFSFDRISVMSASQIPFFTSRGYPVDRINVTLHGVDSGHFRPAPEYTAARDGKLRMLLVGSTERDHEFAASVMRRLTDKPVCLDVLTSAVNRKHYEDLANVRHISGLNDEQLVMAYQQADLLLMPVLDSTANNALLESMACGTPVMVNRVGGVPEYVDPSCNFVMEGKVTDEWADRILQLSEHPGQLASLRPGVRAWAEKLDWRNIKAQYLSFYDAATSNPPIEGTLAGKE